MPEAQICPDCGAPLPGNAPRGFCPECLMRAGALEPTQVAENAAIGTDAGIAGAVFEPRKFGDYELLEEIARGGMGIVYKARQVSLNRTVAVKMLLFGVLASHDTVQRFRMEAAAAASLQHPHIVAIYEVGFLDGQHFFAMEYVAGRSLAAILRDGPLAPRRAAAYLKIIADAIHYAHDRGILHRDLKPSNVLIDGFDQPKVTDFGLAKRLETEIELTLSGQLLGSPNYMPPEQAAARRGAVGKRSDVYALGAILYHLLTGRPPFVGATVAETLQEVLHSEPASPRILSPGVPRDLETICLKCLEKEPSKRYESAALLAEELGRFLTDEPIQARAITRHERAWRWCRRKPLIAALAASLALVLIAGTAGVLTQLHRARKSSEENRRQVVQLNVISGMQLMQAGDYLKSLLWFTEALRVDAGRREREEIHRWRIASVLEQSPRLVQVISHDGNRIAGASFNATDDRLATVGAESGDRTARIWDIPSGQLRMKTRRLPATPYSVLFSPDGTRLLVVLSNNSAALIDADTGQVVGKPLPHRLEGARNGPVYPAFDPTGQRVVTQPTERQLQVWSARTGEPFGAPMIHSNRIERLQFYAGGARLLTRTEELTSCAWALDSGTPLAWPLSGSDAVLQAFLSPAGDSMLLGGRLCKWSSENGVLKPEDQMPLVEEGWLTWAEFSPETLRVATASLDRTARIWDAADGKPLTPPLPHEKAVARVFFSPDGHRLATVSRDDLTRLWDADSGEPLTPPIPHASGAGPSAFSGSGRYWLTVHPNYVVCVWDLQREAHPPVLLKPLQGDANATETAAHGGVFVRRGAENLIRITSASGSGVPLHPLSLKIIPSQLWFDETSRFVLLAGDLAKVQVWEASTGLGLAITPPVQGRFTDDEAACRRVHLSSVDAAPNDLVELAQLLAGSKLDGKGGWSLLESYEMTDLWARLSGKVRFARDEFIQVGPAATPLTHWHQREATAAEGAADWAAAAFHWARLAALNGSSANLLERAAHARKGAVNSNPDSAYHERRAAIPPRDPQATARQIDLSSRFTAPIAQGYSNQRRDIGLQAGLQNLAGVMFDVRGLIQLFGYEHDRRQVKLPDLVEGIRIQQRAIRCHFLHAEQWADWNETEGAEIATVVVSYSNGQAERVPIRQGLEVAGDWYSSMRDPKAAEVAWIGVTLESSANQTCVALYKYTWANPHPDWEIATLDLESGKRAASYVLLAITIE